MICNRINNFFTACRFTELFSHVGCEEPDGILTYRSLLETIVCHPPTESCYDRSCVKCRDTSYISGLFKDKFEEQGIEEIEYKQWKSTGRCTIKTTSRPVDEFREMLCKSLSKLAWHDYVAQNQSRFIKEVKADLKEGDALVIMDFSENYAFIVQDAIQGYHWNNDHATLFPVVVYYNENGELHHLSFVGISDCNKHDTISVYMFQSRLIEYLKDRLGKINNIVYFTDGAPSQFKNKKSFLNLAHHSSDFGIEAEWNFFATAHGKGPSDGLGGLVKRLARIASLRMTRSQILNAGDLFQWCRTNIAHVKFVYCTSEDIVSCQKKLESRLSKAIRVTGTQNFHRVVPTMSTDSLIFQKTSYSEKRHEIIIT